MLSRTALVLFSGGQDSTTCLYWAKERYRTVKALTIYYGQRHEIEQESAIKIAARADVELEIMDLSSLFTQFNDSALLSNQDINEQHRVGELPASFVPGRNIVLLTAAAMYAYKLSINHIVTGVCQTDYSGYPDCRDDTIKSLQTTLNLGMFNGIGQDHFTIHTPLMFLTKAETVKLATTFTGCFEALSYSYTCYEGKEVPCMACPSCMLRAKGFEEAGYADPALVKLFEKARHEKNKNT